MSVQLFDADATFSLVIPRGTITVSTTYPGVRANVLAAPTCVWCIAVSAVSATGTYTFALQVSDVLGGTYLPIAAWTWPAGTSTPHQVAVGVSATAARMANPQAAYVRVVATLGGASPSVTLESWVTKPGGAVGLGTRPGNVYAAI